MSENFSSSWIEVRLGQLVKGYRGVSYRPEQLQYHSTELTVTLLRATNIQNGALTFDDVQFVPNFLATPNQLLEFGDIAVCMSNGSKALVGKSAPYRKHEKHTHTVGAFCSIFKPVDKSNAEFVLHLFKSQIYQKTIDLALAGSAINNLKNSSIEETIFRIPESKKHRDKIAAILTTVDTAIEKTEALIEKYQQIKAGLMHDLFTRGVLLNGKLRPPREQAPELYQETAVGWIPKEWEVCKMIDLADNKPGSTTIGPFGSNLVAADYRSEGVPIVFVRDIKTDGFQWNSDTYVSESKAIQLSAHNVKKGDILATKMGLPPCVSCLYPEWMPDGVMTADIIRLTPNKKLVYSFWLPIAINQDRVIRQVAAITAGVTRSKVTLFDFRNIKIAKPDLQEQELIADKVLSIQKLIDTEKEQRDKLNVQKLGLMQDLLTGKVEVRV